VNECKTLSLGGEDWRAAALTPDALRRTPLLRAAVVGRCRLKHVDTSIETC
jgi:hypothetical protein